MDIAVTEIEQGNDVFIVQIAAHDLLVGKDEVIRALGYPKGSIPGHFDEMIDRILARMPEQCTIRAGYRILDVGKQDNRSNGFYAGDTFFATQNIIAARMKNAEKAACFVCTIGPEMETWAGQLVCQGDTVMGHLVDTAATVTVESAVDALHTHLGNRMRKQGKNITNRYSPGYCGWPVSDQHALFSLFPEKFCGVSLTESALMIPVKSVSGVVGIGPDVTFAGYECNLCEMNDCIYRAFRAMRKN